jgi:spore maturation protein CgeB
VRLLKPLLGAVGPLEDKDLGRFVSDCRVMLGLNEGRDVCGRYRSYLKIRDIEFPGYGACYLTQHNDDIERAFDVGREVLTFRSISEAAAIIRECVRSPARSQALGRAARRRVLAEHTWKSRLRELAEAL